MLHPIPSHPIRRLLEFADRHSPTPPSPAFTQQNLRLPVIVAEGSIVPIQLCLVYLAECRLPAYCSFEGKQRLRLLARPPAFLGFLAGEGESVHGFGADVHTVAGRRWCDMVAVSDGGGVVEVLM